MKIKKFEAKTEQEALEKVKEEFGVSALILNIKKTQPKGALALFKKPVVEVTAALEEGKPESKPEMKKRIVEPEKPDTSGFDENFKQNALRERKLHEQEERIKELENKLNSTSGMLQKATGQLSLYKYEEKRQQSVSTYQNNLIQVFYDALMEQGVLPEIAHGILDEIDAACEVEKIELNTMVKIVYNAIISILGDAAYVDCESLTLGEPKVLAFIGNTGVGKTTTIAKLSADFILNRNLEVGLITADTYRIAAVEQLRVYADILGIEIGIAYTPEDLIQHVETMKKQNHLLLIDTAGRSHKNSEAVGETKAVLEAVPESEKFLVLSLGTKYEDLLDIIEAYSNITDFRIIFTKLDETKSYGSILNVCYKTSKKISYVTQGQNVPDDIEVIKPEKIAKALLGLGE